MHPRKLTRLRAGLEALRGRYGARHLSSDPLEFPRRFERPEDREVVGLIAASLAYGNVATIRGSVERILSRLGPQPAAFIRSLEPRTGRALFRGFRHRFNSGKDIACLLYFIRQMVGRWGSVGEFFREGYDRSEPHLGRSLSSFSERALALDRSGLYSRGVRFFFPSPRDGGACKRLNMYLRWMVRPDDGVDLGLWRFVSPSQLVMPLDTHVARIGQHLGWTRRKTTGWKMALDVTRSLAQVDPQDPTKFDFAISRMGILEHCPRHRGRVQCDLCDLRRLVVG